MKNVLLILILAFSKLLNAQISKADHDTLFVNLNKINQGQSWIQYSVDKSNSIFKKTEYSWQDLTMFFNEYYTSNTLSANYLNYIKYPMFNWFGETVNFKMQLAHKNAILKKINLFINENDNNILKYNKLKIEDIFLSLDLISSLASDDNSVIADSSKNSIFSIIEEWINEKPYFNRKNTVNCSEFPYMAILGFQMQLILIGAKPLTIDRLNNLSNIFSLPEKHSLILKKHNFYIADNNKMSNKDLDFIDKMMELIPDRLRPDLRALSNYDYYYENNQERLNQKLEFKYIYINTYDKVGGSIRNPFPTDIEAKICDGFSNVVAHEVTHRADAYINNISSLKERKSQLLTQAGTEKMQYLRSMFEGSFFQNSPQEFIASIANQWFCDSKQTLKLGLKRFDNGYNEPINQVLFFCELYSLGDNYTRFYSTDVDANVTVQNVYLKRDSKGHIIELKVDNSIYNFQIDSLGNVLNYSVDFDLTGINTSDNFTTLKIYPNPTHSIIFINTGNYNLTTNYTINIQNIYGQQVYKTLTNQNEFQIDMNSFGNPGMYIVRIFDDSRKVIMTKKIILN